MIPSFTKVLKSTKKLIVLCAFALMVSSAFGQGFLKADGKKIVDGNGNEIILKGMGLGGWMLMEGYMMQSSDVAGTQHEFKNRLIDLMGETKTDEFFDAWLANHCTKADIDSLANWGFNSVRLPMHYNLFTLPIEDEPVQGQNTWLNTGFDMVDSLLSWCESNSFYLILDLHAAPGGQGADAAISDYDPTKPSLWESVDNRNKTVALWGRLAERYSDEPWMGGYDLINETNWNLPGGTMLRNLYDEITAAIRAVDNNHIIFIEGNWFANDFTGLTPPWDNNMVYSFHKYWNYNDPGSIQWVLNLREQHNVPLWMGESGENSNVWFQEAISLFEDNGIGWAWWPMKRIETTVGHYSIPFTDGYKNILNYWRGQAPQPTIDEAYSAMMELADNANSSNCSYHKDVCDAQIRQITTDEIIPFTQHTIPGLVFLSDYDLGRNTKAYYDMDVANYQQSTGTFQAWNSGWTYRNDGVDIESNTDPINSNGFHVGYVQKGEWMKYTVQVEESAAYTAKVRLASQNTGGEFHLAIDDEDLSGQQTVSTTGGWTNFDFIGMADILINQGQHILSFHIDSNAEFNISSIEFIKTGDIQSVPFRALNGETGDNEKLVKVTLSHAINPEPITGAMGQFQLKINNIEQSLTSLTMDETKERTLILGFDEPNLFTDIISVSYTGESISSPSGKILEQFSDLQIRNTLPQRFALPVKIQAEAYHFMDGLATEECSDSGGGLNIGYTDAGDFADYLIYASADEQYRINIRLAAYSSSGNIGFYLLDENMEETELCTVTTPVTGGWQTWETTPSGLVQVPKGIHTLRMRVLNGGFNMNWFEFEKVEGIAGETNQTPAPQVYPNPALSNKLFINTDQLKQTSIPVDIYSISGNLIVSSEYSISNGGVEIDISNFPKGVFILRIIAGKKVYNYKIVRE